MSQNLQRLYDKILLTITNLKDTNLSEITNPRSFHTTCDRKRSPSFLMMDFDIW